MSTTRDTIRNGLTASLDLALVDRMLDAYFEAKQNFYLGGQRLTAVEAGRFCEAAFRLLQQRTTGTFDALGTQLNTENVIRALSNMPSASQPDAVRLHIPRALRVVYDVRNKRNNAHLADGIDPNVQDATLVVSILDWVLAEFVRLYHSVSPDKAQEIVESLVTRKVPAIQHFNGFQKILRNDLGVSDFVLLLLYARGAAGATTLELQSWVRPKMRKNLSRAFAQLENDKAYVHRDEDRLFITSSGQQVVEAKRLMAASE